MSSDSKPTSSDSTPNPPASDRALPDYRPGEALRARLRGPGSPLMDDQRLTRGPGLTQFQAIGWFDRAHLIMLERTGLVSRALAARSMRVLLHADPDELAELARPPAENFLAETLLIRHLGLCDGGWIALGRSTHDLNGVAWRLRLRHRVLELGTVLLDLRDRLLDLAERETRTLMPHYTHRVEGQMTTLGHVAHAFASALERDTARLRNAYHTVNRSPAGAAAGVATPFAIDRDIVAELLGFDGVADNTTDAICHDGMHEVACALSILATTMARLGEALFQWHRLGFVDIDDSWCRSSSLMPGKRSVTAIEEFGQLLHELVNGRSPVSHPVWYWGELLDSAERCRWVVEVMATLVPQLAFDRAAMRARLDGFWAMGVDLAATLVESAGLSWRAAHQVVMVAIRSHEDAGLPGYRLTAEALARAAEIVLGRTISLSEATVAAAQDPDARLDRYSARGAIAPHALMDAIRSTRTVAASDRAWLDATAARNAEAHARVERESRALAQGADPGGTTPGADPACR